MKLITFYMNAINCMIAKLKALLNLPLVKLLRETFQEWNEDKAPRLAAALAYYTAFSLAPLLIVVISIAGLIFGQDAVQGNLQYQIQNVVGSDAASAIQEMLVNFHRPDANILATIIGLVTLLLGAAGLFGQLQDALNTVWEVAPKPGQGIMIMLRQRFISFTMVLGIGFVLVVSLVISTVMAAVGTWMEANIPAQAAILGIVNFVVSFGVITLMFGAIYKILPDVKIAWRDVWMGAIVTAVLFTVGKYALGLYLGSSSVSSGYGAAGSFVLLLLWVFYSAQILLFGAEFTQVYSRTYGTRIEPSKNAVMLSEEARSQQGIPHAATVQAIASGTAATEAKAATEQAQKGKVAERRPAPEPVRQPLTVPAVVPVTQESPHLGVLVLGICAALATFVVGMLIGTDQKQAK